ALTPTLSQRERELWDSLLGRNLSLPKLLVLANSLLAPRTIRILDTTVTMLVRRTTLGLKPPHTM
ncbi:MAG TPA: hypothetical protein PKI05_10420, partial [Thermogutta sp.]|nr:hypothetical protein [Thermogutta sp.]